MKPFNWKLYENNGEEYSLDLHEARFGAFPYHYKIYVLRDSFCQYKILHEDYTGEYLADSGFCNSIEEAKEKCERYHNKILEHVL